MSNKLPTKFLSTLKHASVVALGTFFFAVLLSINSQVFMRNFQSVWIAFTLLIMIILIGIIFDIIGTAATAAHETPFHSRASRRLSGAQQSIKLVRNADKVANFCNDVVGDICGTLSGAIGVSIVFRLTAGLGVTQQLLFGTIMTGFVASMTVGGKAIGKAFGVNQADQIILWSGQILAWLERVLGLDRLNSKGKKKGKQK